MSFGIDEALELERLLLVRAHWDKLANPPKPVLVAPVGPETHEKKAKPPFGLAKQKEKPQDFITRICGEGSDKPSGKALGPFDWMG